MIYAVIPTYNSEASLSTLLSALRPHIMRIIITDGGSTDKTMTIAARHGAVIAFGSPGRGSQLQRGAGWIGDCEWMLVLHADSRLPKHWAELTEAHIKHHPNTAGYFDLRFDSPRFAARVIEFLVRIRCAVFGLPYGDQGLLISAALYKEVGGYPALPLFEDVALVKILGKKRIRRLSGPLLTDASKFERDGFFRRGWRNFRLLRRYLGGEPADDIAKDYK